MMRRFYFLLLFAFGFTLPCLGTSPLETIPFRMIGDHMFIQVVSDDNDTLEFVFDTGASSIVINDRLLTEKSWDFKHEVQSTGVGGSANLTGGKISHLKFGRLEMNNVAGIAASLSHLELRIGHRIDGIIGYNLLKDFVTRIDYEANTLEFFLPEQHPFAGHEQGYHIDLSLGIPAISARVALADGSAIEGKFLIDSGAGSSLILNTPFVNQNELLKKSDNGFRDESMGLSNQPTPFFETIIPQFFLGGHQMEKIPTRLSQGNAGVTALPFFAGIIGNKILRKFSLILDYPGGRMYLQPNKSFHTPISNDASGLKMQLEKSRDKIVIDKVFEHSPAFSAGILPGDVLTAVNGLPVSSEDLNQIRDKLTQSGKSVCLRLKRKEESVTVVITLKEWFL